MNKIFALLVFMLCATVSAQTSVQEWQAKAVEKYPALGIRGSAFNNAFVAEYERRKQAGDGMFRVADWPMRIANFVQLDLAAADVKAASSRGLSEAPTPVPALVPQPGSERSKGDNEDGLNFSLTPADMEKLATAHREMFAAQAREIEAEKLAAKNERAATTVQAREREADAARLDAEEWQVAKSQATAKRAAAAAAESQRATRWRLAELIGLALALVGLMVWGGELKRWLTWTVTREYAPPTQQTARWQRAFKSKARAAIHKHEALTAALCMGLLAAVVWGISVLSQSGSTDTPASPTLSARNAPVAPVAPVVLTARKAAVEWISASYAKLLEPGAIIRTGVPLASAVRDRGLRNAVQPFVDRYSELLPAVLEMTNGPDKTPHHSIVDFFPPDSRQPAWVALLRGGRIHICTDDKDHVKVFLLGDNPAQAYSENYSVIRHCLAMLQRHAPSRM